MARALFRSISVLLLRPCASAATLPEVDILPRRRLRTIILATAFLQILLGARPGAGQMDWSLVAADYPRWRERHAMAYDAARRQIVLFGGWSSGILGDTWIWRRDRWDFRSPARSPSPREDHAMAYDGVRKRVLLFGGWSGNSVLNDTWEWDGQTWVQQHPVTSPPARGAHAMVWDSVRNRVLLFGGANAVSSLPLLNDTWEWDGSAWTRVNTRQSPPASLWPLPVVYDAARGAMVLCHAGSHEIWAYAPRDLTLSPSLVSVRTGGHVTLSLDAGASDAGKGYWLAGCMDAPAPKGLRLGNVTLQLHPDPYFWLTARYPNPVIVNSVGVLDAAGKATATLRVPRLPTGFIGMRFLHAYVVFRSRIERASPPVPLTLVK